MEGNALFHIVLLVLQIQNVTGDERSCFSTQPGTAEADRLKTAFNGFLHLLLAEVAFGPDKHQRIFSFTNNIFQ